MGAKANAAMVVVAGVLVACGAAPVAHPTSPEVLTPTLTSAPRVEGSTLAAPEDLAAARADAERRVREIDEATRCDFNTPDAERKRRQMEQKQQAAQRELDED